MAFLSSLWDIYWFWGGRTKIVLKNKRQKKLFFFNQSQVLGLFLGWVGKVYEVCQFALDRAQSLPATA